MNGFSFDLYFGVWTTINAGQMLFLWGAIMGLIQIYQGRDSALDWREISNFPYPESGLAVVTVLTGQPAYKMEPVQKLEPWS